MEFLRPIPSNHSRPTSLSLACHWSCEHLVPRMQPVLIVLMSLLSRLPFGHGLFVKTCFLPESN